jgi:hypothetical protein
VPRPSQDAEQVRAISRLTAVLGELPEEKEQEALFHLSGFVELLTTGR